MSQRSAELEAILAAVPVDFADGNADFNAVRAMMAPFHGHPVAADLHVEIRALGPVAAGFMIDAQGFRAAYILLLLMPLATLLSARLVPYLAPAGAAEVPAGRSAWDLLRSPGLKRLLAVNWLLSMCWDVHTFAVPILGHQRGFNASTIGLILGTFTLSVTAIRLALLMVVDAIERRLGISPRTAELRRQR